MNILFLTSRFPTDNNHFTLEKELVYAFNKDGHQCTVANILERKFNKCSNISYIKAYENANHLLSDIKILNIKTGNLFNDVNFFEKKLTALSLSYIFTRKIKQLLPINTLENEQTSKIDLIIAYGPYLCGYDLIKPLKKYYNAKTMLVQWDIFPQNAYDLGIIKNKLIFNYFKHKQKLMLKEYDLILCNSEGNIEYFKNHYPNETHNKLLLFHNCEAVRDTAQELHTPLFSGQNKLLNASPTQSSVTEKLRISLRQKYQIPLDSTALIFGGNIGIPQALENIIKIADKLNNNKIFFVIIGQGTEAGRIKQLCANKSYLKFIDFMPSQEYENLLKACDYGIISLSPKFTVPNFPAKVTTYLKIGLPIFACLDDCSYNDLGKFINNNHIGLAIKYSNFDINVIKKFLLNDQNYMNTQNNTNQVFNQYMNISNNFTQIKAILDKTEIKTS